MKKLIISILLVAMLISAFSISGCNKTEDNPTAADGETTTTTLVVDVTLPKPQGAAMYEFEKYGYHIYYPQGFTLNMFEDEDEMKNSNMREFIKDGADFTILVLDNNYTDIEVMKDREVDDSSEIIKSGSNFFLVYSAGNGRTSYTYYYFGEHMVTCELSYPDSRKDSMKGLEDQIMVEVHSHAH